ncbi:MAG TPA: polyprenol monophosphomannose synthase [Gemmataceae bacterium]
MQGASILPFATPAGPDPLPPPGPRRTPDAPEVARQRLLVSIATYNERDNLAGLVAAIHAELPHADVLVIDDNSPDGTGDLADELALADRRVRVLHRAGKLGLGTAILAGMRYAIDGRYDLLLNIDADFSHPPRYLRWLVSGMRDHDVMIGSRYVPGGGTVNWPWSRRLISRAVNLFVRLALRLPVRDASGAYRCYRVDLLRRADLAGVRSRGYSFQQEVLYRCHRAGARIGEFPIVFENRKAGASKVSLRESVRSLSMLAWLGVKATLRLG